MIDTSDLIEGQEVLVTFSRGQQAYCKFINGVFQDVKTNHVYDSSVVTFFVNSYSPNKFDYKDNIIINKKCFSTAQCFPGCYCDQFAKCYETYMESKENKK